MPRLFKCNECGVSFKHHELIQHRRPRLVYVGYDRENFSEIWDYHRCGAGYPMHNIADHRWSARTLRDGRPVKKQDKIPHCKYIRKGQKKVTKKRKPDLQEWRKRPRMAYCTGCGYIWTHMHLLKYHRNLERCGGRFLPPEQRAHVEKLRREREAQMRTDRFIRALEVN